MGFPWQIKTYLLCNAQSNDIFESIWDDKCRELVQINSMNLKGEGLLVREKNMITVSLLWEWRIPSLPK